MESPYDCAGPRVNAQQMEANIVFMIYSKFSRQGCMLFPLSQFLNYWCNFQNLFFFLKFQNTHKKLSGLPGHIWKQNSPKNMTGMHDFFKCWVSL